MDHKWTEFIGNEQIHLFTYMHPTVLLLFSTNITLTNANLSEHCADVFKYSEIEENIAQLRTSRQECINK